MIDHCSRFAAAGIALHPPFGDETPFGVVLIYALGSILAVGGMVALIRKTRRGSKSSPRKITTPSAPAQTRTGHRQHLTFGALCVFAPSAMIVFALMCLSHETFAAGCSLVGLLAALVVFFWSLFSIRRHPLRAVFGIFICLVVFWLLLIIPGYVEAKRRRLVMRPNHQIGCKALALWLPSPRPAGSSILNGGEGDKNSTEMHPLRSLRHLRETPLPLHCAARAFA